MHYSGMDSDMPVIPEFQDPFDEPLFMPKQATHPTSEATAQVYTALLRNLPGKLQRQPFSLVASSSATQSPMTVGGSVYRNVASW